MSKEVSSRPRLSAPQFRSQWKKAQDEINQLVTLGIKLQSLMPSIYEGVMGEEAPDYDSAIEWDEREATG